jgi:hypothetical protein
MSANLIFQESFDMWNGWGDSNNRWQSFNAGGSINGSGMETGPYGGGQGMRLGTGTGGPAQGRVPFAPTGSPLAVALCMHIKINSTGNSGVFLQVLELTTLTVQFSVGCNANGSLIFYNGAGTAVFTSPAVTFIPGVWGWMDLEVNIGASAAVNFYWNNTLLWAGTGVNTRGAGTGGANWLLPISTGAGNPQTVYDNIMIGDTATRFGEHRLDTLRPASDVSKQWTPNSGSNNYDRVNETTQNSDTTYIQSNTLGQVDRYTLSALPITPQQITAINIVSIARKTDAGARAINNVLWAGGTQYNGSDYQLVSSYSRNDRLLTTNPNTGLPWTAADIAALNVGPRLAA